MRSIYRILLSAALFTLASVATAQSASVDGRKDVLAEFELLHAQPFVLEQPYVHTWRKETPAVHAGYVLVLKTELHHVVRRQTQERVLFVGNQTAERVNAPPSGSGETGQIVVIVPAPLREDGTVDLDPWKARIFFGTAPLAEDVDEQRIAVELRRARRLELGPARRPRDANGELLPIPNRPTLPFADRHALDLKLAELVEFYSPLEVDLVAGLRVPIHR